MHFKAKCCAVLSIILVLRMSASVFAETDNERIWQELSEIKDGIIAGFGTQWTLIQRLRFQGIKRHRALVHIFREVQKIGEQIKTLKNQRGSRKDAGPLVRSGTCTPPLENVQGHCLLIVKRKESWDDANKFCKSQGGFLFDGRNATLFNVIRNHLKKVLGPLKAEDSFKEGYLWVGGRYVDEKWIWVKKGERSGETSDADVKQKWNKPRARFDWVAGSGELAPIGPKVWAPSEPRRKLGTSSLCVALDGNSDYKGVAAFCRHYRKFVCSF